MREIKKIDENSYLGVFKNVVHKDNYRNYEIFVVKMYLEIPFYMFDLSENHTWYNGYIVIPKDSKYYGMDYYSIEINIHGGFTFAEFIEDEYVIGFDTNHGFDDENTQNVDFVLKELKNAVDQIEKEKELKNKGEK